MRSPDAPTASKSFASGTPSNLRGPSYQGVVVENEVSPSASSIARSNCAVPSLLVTLILPVTVKIGLSAGSGKDAAPARFAATSTTAPNNGVVMDRSPDSTIILMPRAKRMFALRVSQTVVNIDLINLGPGIGCDL